MYVNWDNLPSVKVQVKKKDGLTFFSNESLLEGVCPASTTLPVNGSVAQPFLHGFL